jgi:hypothetical protein
METLLKSWQLIKAPLNCGSSMLKEIQLRFTKEHATVCDMANSTSGKYTLVVANDKSGTINIKYNGWTERGRLWRTDQEWKEAKLVDEFIHSLIRTPFDFKLEDNMLKVYYKGEEYQFE